MKRQTTNMDISVKYNVYLPIRESFNQLMAIIRWDFDKNIEYYNNYCSTKNNKTNKDALFKFDDSVVYFELDYDL